MLMKRRRNIKFRVEIRAYEQTRLANIPSRNLLRTIGVNEQTDEETGQIRFRGNWAI